MLAARIHNSRGFVAVGALLLIQFLFCFRFCSAQVEVVDVSVFTEIANKIERGQLTPKQSAELIITASMRAKLDVPNFLISTVLKDDSFPAEFYYAEANYLMRYIVKPLGDEQLGRLAEMNSSILPPGSEWRRFADKLLVFYAKVVGYVSVGQLEQVDKLRFLATSPKEEEIVAEALRQASVFSAGRRAELGDPYGVLMSLSWAKNSTAKADDDIARVELLRTALLKIRDREVRLKDWPFSKEAVRRTVFSYESERDDIRQVLIDIFSKYAPEFALSGDAENSVACFRWVIERRSDPNPLNDRLRYKIAFSASTPETLKVARDRVLELHYLGTLTLGNRILLIYRGVYGLAYPMALTLCIIIIVFSSALILYRNLFFRLPKVSTTLSGGKHDEYSRLLANLELTDEASGIEIKRRFREISKQCHPDKIKSLPNRAKLERDYLRAKAAYDRIVEIRKGWFSGWR